jgi:hypothetical protein
MGTDWNGSGNTEQDRPDAMPTAANVDKGSLNNRPYYPQGPRGKGAGCVLAHNSGQGPDFFAIDLRVSKFIPIGGQRSLEQLAEFFNITNRVNQNIQSELGPEGNVRSSQYYPRRLRRGDIMATQTYDPFQAQIGIRLNFELTRPCPAATVSNPGKRLPQT